MNQILLTENPKEVKKNKKSKIKEPKNNSTDLKKVILFFAVLIIIFGVALGGIYGYKIYKNKTPKEVQKTMPKLALEENEDTTEVIIKVKSEDGIDKIIYSWNDEDENIEELNGKKNPEQALQIPEGDNTLKVKVIDINGQEIETTKQFSVAISKKPTIEIAKEGTKIKITAKSENSLKYITYRWNDEEEIKVEPENEDTTIIEELVDAKRGNNRITVTAVDTKNVQETLSRPCQVVNNPVINVEREGNIVYMQVSHDLGIKSIEFIINDKTYMYDENSQAYDPDKKDIEYTFKLQEGDNTVIITATSIEDSTEIFRGITNYALEN